jgi:hypothetical protein
VAIIPVIAACAVIIVSVVGSAGIVVVETIFAASHQIVIIVGPIPLFGHCSFSFQKIRPPLERSQ